MVTDNIPQLHMGFIRYSNEQWVVDMFSYTFQLYTKKKEDIISHHIASS